MITKKIKSQIRMKQLGNMIALTKLHQEVLQVLQLIASHTLTHTVNGWSTLLPEQMLHISLLVAISLDTKPTSLNQEHWVSIWKFMHKVILSTDHLTGKNLLQRLKFRGVIMKETQYQIRIIELGIQMC